MNAQYNFNLMLPQPQKPNPLISQVNQIFQINPEAVSFDSSLFNNRNLPSLKTLNTHSNGKNIKVAMPSELLTQDSLAFFNAIQSAQTFNPFLLPISEPFLKEKQILNNIAQYIERQTQATIQNQRVARLSEITNPLFTPTPKHIEVPSGPNTALLNQSTKIEEPLAIKESKELKNHPQKSSRSKSKKRGSKAKLNESLIASTNNLKKNENELGLSSPQCIKQETTIEPNEQTNLDRGSNESIEIEPPALTVLTKEFPDWDLGKIVEFVGLGRGRNDLVKRPLRGAEDYAYEELFVQKPEEDESENLSEEQKEELFEEYIKRLTELLGYSNLDREKVRKILTRKKYNLHKALIFVRKNLSFYKKYFTLNSTHL